MYLGSRATAIVMSQPWLPKGWLAWASALAGSATAVVFAMVAFAMLVPVHWEGPFRFGPRALLFPLNVLIFVPVLLLASYLSVRSQALLGAVAFAATAALSLLMALVPAALLWSAARSFDVPLSLRNYLEHARHWNWGAPEPARSVVYGVAKDGTKLELDVWPSGRPRTGPLRPAVVIVHGGGWTSGNRNNTPDWNRWLNQLGFEVFDVEYRLPPPVRFLDEVGDVKAAIGWVAANAGSYHVDPAKISLMGASAGANLALLAAYSMGDPRLPPSTEVAPVAVHSVINLYAPTDLVLLDRDSTNRGYARATLESYIGGRPEAFPERYRLVSPLTHVSAEAPRTLTLAGTCDRLVSLEHSRLLHAALERAGVASELIVLPATEHAFDLNWGGFATQIARAKIAAFLERAATER